MKIFNMKISERPLVQRFEGRTAVFKDGSTAEVDVVLMCTGYLHSYPFLRLVIYIYIYIYIYVL